MLYTADDLTLTFPSQYLARGRQYQRMGKVRGLAMTGNGATVIAEVSGTAPEPYDVFIEITRGSRGSTSIEGSCTCPVGYNCKHVAAALLQALQEGRGPVGEGLSTPLEEWFRRLSAAADFQSSETYPPEVRERVLYLLRPSPHNSTTVAVKVVVARRLKAGGYGAERDYNPQNILSGQPARFVSQADQPILRELALCTWLNHRLVGTEGATLLERMLTTGRCHWESKDNLPLSMGAPRKADPRWITSERGLTRLGFETDPPADWVLPVNPLWYVDLERGLCGPAESPLPVALAAELATSPDLSPEDLSQVGDWLGQHLPTAQLPPPPAVEVKTVTLTPYPVLTLYSRPFRAPYYGYYKAEESPYIDGARLTFDYEGEMVSPEDEREAFSRYQDGQVLRISRDRKTETACVRRLGRLGLERLSKLHNSYALSLSSVPARDFGLPGEERWLNFMMGAVPQLRKEGWRIEVEADFRFNLATVGDWYVDVEEGGIDWFGLTLGVEVDGEPVNLMPVLVDFLRNLPPGSSKEWLEQLEENQQLMVPLHDGRLLPLPAERIRSVLDVLVELYDGKGLGLRDNLNLPRIQAGRLAELETALQGLPLRWQGGAELRQLAERLRGASIPETVPIPRGLHAELRPYQQRGLAWLQFLREQELGGILADDMGLGKTVQTLAHIQLEKSAGRLDRPCLIVAPTSLMVNWRDEAARFAPELKTLILRGPQRHEQFAEIPVHDIVLTTYPLLPRDREALLAHKYHLLILDEAQAIKNPRSQAGLVVRELPTHHRLCLTGTPMENHLGELWSLFDFLMPGLLGDEQQFRQLFRRPIEQASDETRRETLVRRIAPFLLRRTKEQVAAELPAKTEIVRTVGLSGTQRDLYESIRLAMQEKVRSEIKNKGLARSHIVILEALLKLRQVCCDPRLLKLESARRVKQSAKLQLLMEILPELVENGRHILLFSQFTSMLALIEAELARLKIDYVKLTGQTRDRATPIEHFQNGKVPLFLISLKAGGVGLNLTTADTVIHYDPWWNPAVEDQATDRAHRIGQDKPVFVYKLFTEGTVEEKIRLLQTRKRELTSGLLDTKDTAAPQWTDQDLEQLFAPLG